MRRDQLEHAIRTACQIIGHPAVIIVGSQAILGSFGEDELPVEPAPAPRPRLPNQRRQHPPHPSPRRHGGEPLALTTNVDRVVATTPKGQIPWPPPVSSRGRQRAGFMTASGQKPMALDSRDPLSGT